jgi:DNA transposition AAA+ family ATPase
MENIEKIKIKNKVLNNIKDDYLMFLLLENNGGILKLSKNFRIELNILKEKLNVKINKEIINK